MTNTSLVQKFLAEIGDDKLFVYEAEFMPLLVLIDWFKYYDANRTLKTVYPVLCYKKGRLARGYVSLTKHYEATQSVFRPYLDGNVDIEKLTEEYKHFCHQVGQIYDDYYESTDRDEKTLLNQLSAVYQASQEFLALTFFLDGLDQYVIKQTLDEKNIRIDLDKVFEVSHIADFASFDSHNNETIINTVKAGKKLATLQYIFTTYTSVLTPAETEEKIKEINIQTIETELIESKKLLAENIKAKAIKKESLSLREERVLRFIDWASWIRDHRKEFINKSDTLIFNLVSDLYRTWGVPLELVPVSLIFEVLKGKDYITQNLDHLRQRPEKLIGLYHGKDQYEESFTLPEEEIRLLDELFLQQNKPQVTNTFQGEAASRGQAQGKVRIVQSQSEFPLFEEGEILVTGMTRPEFVPLMKRAAAIITDEGGVTSHAAIVSRELKKPCIIGTKVGTKILHTGDLVQVDANTGTVTIIEKNTL